MRILILSEDDMIKMMKNELDEKTILISILNPSDEPVKLKNRNLLGTFYMSFWDVEENDEIPYATKEDIKGLKNFIDRYKDDAETIVVNCEFGASRSPAVAAGISDYLGIDHNIFFDINYGPNYHIYKLVHQELGIQKEESFYETLFCKHEKYIKNILENKIAR